MICLVQQTTLGELSGSNIAADDVFKILANSRRMSGPFFRVRVPPEQQPKTIKNILGSCRLGVLRPPRVFSGQRRAPVRSDRCECSQGPVALGERCVPLFAQTT